MDGEITLIAALSAIGTSVGHVLINYLRARRNGNNNNYIKNNHGNPGNNKYLTNSTFKEYEKRIDGKLNDIEADIKDYSKKIVAANELKSYVRQIKGTDSRIENLENRTATDRKQLENSINDVKYGINSLTFAWNTRFKDNIPRV